MTKEQIARQWMENSKKFYLSECEDAQDALGYLVEDCNSEAGIDLEDDELLKIAKEVLDIE